MHRVVGASLTLDRLERAVGRRWSVTWQQDAWKPNPQPVPGGAMLPSSEAPPPPPSIVRPQEFRFIASLSTAPLGAQISVDSFDTDTSANYAVRTTADALATFAFDYSTLGIPSAPHTPAATTLGIKLEANISTGALHVVTLHTHQLFTGDRLIKSDAWVNANGPFPGGGTGSTEFLTFGVGGDGLSTHGVSGSGGWFAVSGEGGSTRDYRGYKI